MSLEIELALISTYEGTVGVNHPHGMNLAPLAHGMSMFIARADTSEGCCLRIDGRLEEDSLGELEKACKNAEEPLTLDLEGVRWIDDRARELLRQLVADGAFVKNASPYVSLRLRDEE